MGGLSCINKFPPGTQISAAADQVKAPPGSIYVKGHGIVDPGPYYGWLKGDDGKPIDPADLAAEIYNQNDLYTNTKIVLLICNAGGGNYYSLVYNALRNGTWRGSLSAPDSMIFFDSTNTLPQPYGPIPNSWPYAPNPESPGRYKKLGGKK